MQRKNDRVHQFFKYQENLLDGYVKTLKEVVSHAGTKGVELESLIRDFFIEFIPERFRCTTGFLIDKDRNLSPQIDIIIYDQMSIPKFFSYGTFNVLPIEAVSVICEVKMNLTLRELRDSFLKFSKVKSMSFFKEKVIFSYGNALQWKETAIPNMWVVSYTSCWKTERGFRKAVKKIFNLYPELSFVKILVLDRGIVEYADDKQKGITGLKWIVPKARTGDREGVILAWFLYQRALPQLFSNPRGVNFWLKYIPWGSYEIRQV